MSARVLFALSRVALLAYFDCLVKTSIVEVSSFCHFSCQVPHALSVLFFCFFFAIVMQATLKFCGYFDASFAFQSKLNKWNVIGP